MTNQNNLTISNKQIINKPQITNYKSDLEERTLTFSKQVIDYCKGLPKNGINFNLVDQLVRSATSIGANYREANDSLGKKDFINRLRIARKEAKETSYWLELMKHSNSDNRVDWLIQETRELRNILSSIISKLTK